MTAFLLKLQILSNDHDSADARSLGVSSLSQDLCVSSTSETIC